MEISNSYSETEGVNYKRYQTQILVNQSKNLSNNQPTFLSSILLECPQYSPHGGLLLTCGWTFHGDLLWVAAVARNIVVFVLLNLFCDDVVEAFFVGVLTGRTIFCSCGDAVPPLLWLRGRIFGLILPSYSN